MKVITQIDLIMPAKYTMLKLTLLMRKERFGCDLNFQLQQPAADLTRSIRDLDQYVGQLARAEVYIEGDEPK